MKRFADLFLVCCLASLVGCGRAERPTPPTAAPILPSTRPSPSFAEVVAPALLTYCVACHDDASRQGNVVLDGIDDGTEARSDLALWGRVADAIRSGAMPPKGEPKLDPMIRATLVASIDAEVFRCAEPTSVAVGRVALRRLNRAQYNNTVRDLVGIDLRPADAFPSDDLGYGFDNNGDVLSMPPLLMEKYLAAADSVLDALADRSEWARIVHPEADRVPPSFRKKVLPARSDPVKRIGRPAPEAPRPEDPGAVALGRAYDILRGFADRAFRRPALDEELTRLVGLFESALKDGDTFDEAIRQALAAVLVSPHFLFLVEEDPKVGGTVNDFELAVRLSYFLWNSMPDAELFDLAARGELHGGDILPAQVRRMLRSERSTALVGGFAFQWLQIRGLGDASPDPATFPDFDEPLRQAMLRETALFSETIIRDDRSVFDFLDADFTFVDPRLARHYGISGVDGPGFRRVSLAGTARRGVLTQAGVLTATSSPTRTSPVRRGKWVLDVLLATPPPPPPPDAAGLNDSGGASTSATIRERMERHRADPRCASCHSKMDPIGFALENFDAVGAWRDRDGPSVVDASGTLPDGTAITGPGDLQAALSTRREAFAHCLAEKLTTYALGRGVTPADRCAIDAIALKLSRDDPRFSTLVLGIVESPSFQKRAGAKGDLP